MNTKRIIINGICISLVLAMFIWIGKEEYEEKQIKNDYNTQNLSIQANTNRGRGKRGKENIYKRRNSRRIPRIQSGWKVRNTKD